MPHDVAERVCPTTGRRITPPDIAQSRMSQLPPPARAPEPLGFNPVQHRIGDPPSGAHSASIPRTRNPQRDLIGQNIGGRYLVRGILGEGGMGTVYDAEHLGLGRLVAIKVLNPSQTRKKVAVKRFQQEARSAGSIGHPNICEVYDLGSLDDGSPFLVMEKLVGWTLADRIQREGGLPFDELVDIMIQVLSGLIAAHEKGIVHRDIKPENIFLARRVGMPPIAKILDFGVSKMMPKFAGAEEELDLTRTGMVMGTPYYMSPEQARGERNLDGRVDVYACGVMMYEAIAGRRPFLAPNYNALLLAIINATPPALRQLRPATPIEIEAVVARAMAKARDARHPSALALLTDMQALAPTGIPTARVSEDDGLDTAPAPAREPLPPAVGPAAKLKSRMRPAPPAPPPTDPHATRIDVRSRSGPSLVESDLESDYDIPVHVASSEDALPTAPPLASGEYAEEAETEVFKPGKHRAPPAKTGSTTLAQPESQLPRPHGPVISWEDSQTALHRPDGVDEEKEQRRKKPVRSVEDTVSLEGSLDIDFSDVTPFDPVKPRR